MHTTGDSSLSGRLPFTLILTSTLGLAGLLLAGCPAATSDGAPAEDGSGAAPAAAGAASQEIPEVLATVSGDDVTRAEVEESAAQALAQVETELRQCRMEAEQRRHQTYEQETRKLVRERLLDAAAEERDMTQDELLQTEVQSRVAAVTPAEVDAFYEANRDRIGGAPKEQVAPQIEQYLRQQRETQAFQDFITGLEEANDVAYEIGPYRVALDVEGEPARGPAAAPVTIVEFSDFECPYCSRVVPTLERIKQSYGDRVRLVFKQFPLRNIHPNAQKAAEASLCAQDQGKFWELHDAMFADQRNLGVPALKAKAEQVGLDAAAFAECLDSGRYQAAVQEDLEQGSEAGVAGTPAMFINGRFVSGAVPYEQIAQVVDEELERRGEGS